MKTTEIIGKTAEACGAYEFECRDEYFDASDMATEKRMKKTIKKTGTKSGTGK